MPLVRAGQAAKASVASAPAVDLPEAFADLGPALQRLAQSAQDASDTLVNQGSRLGSMFRATASAYRKTEGQNAKLAAHLRTGLEGGSGQSK